MVRFGLFLSPVGGYFGSVKRVAKAILWPFGVILIIAAVVVLGVNLYVQSEGTRERIETGLTAALRTPVKVGSLSFMPWYGLKLTGISNDSGQAGNGDTIEIPDIALRFQLWKLMNHRVVIKELTVDDVKVGIGQNAEGKWQIPGGPNATGAGDAPQPETSAAQPPAQPEVPSEPAARPVTVRHARLRNAAFTFYDRNNRPIAALTGVYAQTPSPTEHLIQGSAAVSKAEIQKKFYIEDWRGSFKYTPDELSLYDTACKIDGGEANGAVDVKITEPDSPFVLDMNFNGVNFDRLLRDAGVTELEASGLLSGSLHLEGDWRDSQQTQGRGRLLLTNGFIAESDFIESLGAWLRTDKFRRLNLDDAHADFHVGGGAVYLDDLALKSAALTFTSKGAMAADGTKLFLSSRLAINADVARQIPDFLLQNFQTDSSSGARYVDFPITGDIEHPRSSLLKIVSKHMSLKKAWQDFIGGKQPQAAPPATPAQPATTQAPVHS